MKLSVSVALSAILALTSAQGLSDLPKCAQDCATPAIPKNCGLKIDCICTADAFIEAITCCVAKACSKEDQDKTIKFANGICGTAGVSNLPQSAVCSTGTAAATGSSASETGSSSASATAASSSAAPTGSGTPTEQASQSASPSSTGNAAMPVAQNANGGAVAALAALAFALV